MSPFDPSNLVLGNGVALRIVHNVDTRYTTDRGFTINGTADGHSATLDSSPTSLKGVYFSGAASPDYGTADQTRTLILTGTHAATGNQYANVNELRANIADNGSGAVSLLKNGVGSWKLTGNSSYSGGTTLSQGWLRIGLNNNCLGSGTLTVNGGTVATDDNRIIANSIVLNSNSTFVAAALTTPYSLTLTGDISGAGGLTASGVGTLTLSNTNNTYGGDTIVTNGVLTLTSDSSLPLTTTLYLPSVNPTIPLDLDFAGWQKIKDLYINGIRQPKAVYGADGASIKGSGFLITGDIGAIFVIH